MPDLDFDAVLAASASKCGQKMKVPQILAALDDVQRSQVERALRDLSVSKERVALALTKIGHPVSSNAILTWRERFVE